MEILICNGTTKVSKLIMWATRSDRSHVGLRYSHPEDAWLVHSTLGGVQPEWWFHFEKKYKDIDRFKVHLDFADQACDDLVKRIGHKPYDYRGFLGQGLALLFGVRSNPLSDKKRYRCTELLCEWHKHVNMLNPDAKLEEFDSEMVTPASLKEYYLKRADAFELITEVI